MGYLKDFRERFGQELARMTPGQIEAVLNTACNAVLESYRNGQKSRVEKKKEGGGEAPKEKRPRARGKN